MGLGLTGRFPARRPGHLPVIDRNEARQLPAALKDDELADTDEKATAARCDRSRRRGLVLLVLLRVGDVGFGGDACMAERYAYGVLKDVPGAGDEIG